MNPHSVFYKATPKRKIKATKILRELKKGKKNGFATEKSQIQNQNGGENRTRTCKPLRAVVFKTTALANYAISPHKVESKI
jgi:hypothetical protein